MCVKDFRSTALHTQCLSYKSLVSTPLQPLPSTHALGLGCSHSSTIYIYMYTLHTNFWHCLCTIDVCVWAAYIIFVMEQNGTMYGGGWGRWLGQASILGRLYQLNDGIATISEKTGRRANVIYAMEYIVAEVSRVRNLLYSWDSHFANSMCHILNRNLFLTFFTWLVGW